MNLARLSVSLVCVLSLGLSGCANMTPGQKQTAIGIAGAVGSLSEFVADTALRVIIAKASGPEDATQKANLLDSGAAYLRSIENETAGVLTKDQIAAGLTSFTDPSKAHWSDLAQQLAARIVASPAPPAVALEDAASSLNQVAATTRVNAAAIGNP